MEDMMFCRQCQEAAYGVACSLTGVCGKKPDLANLQDLLIYAAGGLGAACAEYAAEGSAIPAEAAACLVRDLAMTAVNVNFDPEAVKAQITATRKNTRALLPKLGNSQGLPEASFWDGAEATYGTMHGVPGVNGFPNDTMDVKGLREFILCGLRGIAAFLTEAGRRAERDSETDSFLARALGELLDEHANFNTMLNLAVETGRYAYRAMERRDKALTTAYGAPIITRINRIPGAKPGILIAGSDLDVVAEVLRQTDGTGIEVYTHGEMMAALTYPSFHDHPQFVGNYGGSWWQEKNDFDQFGGPIIVAGDHLVPPGAEYQNRIFTAGNAGFPGVKHLAWKEDGTLDLTEVLDLAKSAPAPEDTATRRSVVGGFGHKRIESISGMIIDDLKYSSIQGFVAILGDDGRSGTREYYTELAKKLPPRTVILTAGTVKYRMEDLNLGDILAIQRLTDMGQAGDAYSTISAAMQFKTLLGVDDINDLPITWCVSWGGPKSIAVLLSLLYLGIHNIYLGPTVPAFITQNVMSVLSSTFDLHETKTVELDLKDFFPASPDEGKGKVKMHITKDMLVGDIVRKYPDVVPTLLACGLHCLGCGASSFETLEEACQVHGVPVDEVLEAIESDPIRN